MRAVHLAISGKVQGVGYRAWMAHEAESRGLDGWVRNRKTGEVEAVIVGDNESVARLIETCWQGPPGARVERVEELSAAADRPTGFTILPTA